MQQQAASQRQPPLVGVTTVCSQHRSHKTHEPHCCTLLCHHLPAHALGSQAPMSPPPLSLRYRPCRRLTSTTAIQSAPCSTPVRVWLAAICSQLAHVTWHTYDCCLIWTMLSPQLLPSRPTCARRSVVASHLWHHPPECVTASWLAIPDLVPSWCPPYITLITWSNHSIDTQVAAHNCVNCTCR